MKKLTYLIFSIVIIFSAGFVLFLVGLYNFPFYGAAKIEAALGQDTPQISRLGPEVRLRNIESGQQIVEGPVYFDVRIMPWYNQAKVIVIYQEIAGHALNGMGRHTGPEFSYEVTKPIAIFDHGDGYKRADFIFDLNGFYQEKNVYRFLVDTVKGQSGGAVEIKELKLFLTR